MARWFNIGGPCNPVDHYMLAATARLPRVVSLIDKKQYFVVHAPRQCGKTTAFRALADEINAKGEMAAFYCSIENVQGIANPEEGLRQIANVIRQIAEMTADCFGENVRAEDLILETGECDYSMVVQKLLSVLARRAGKPLVIFFDEVDCLSEGTLVGFLRQLRNGRITCTRPGTFPVSIALIGLRNIRDYKMHLRPADASTGEASPFNVITEAMTIRSFTMGEICALYRQHTEETGQVFEEGALRLAWEFSQGQPYLVNALARWCVEKIHQEDFSQPITAADMNEAKEKLIRERGTHLDSLMEKVYDPRITPLVRQVLLGDEIDRDVHRDDVAYALDLGLFVEEQGTLKPANPIYRETIGRYMTRGTQDAILLRLPEVPWTTPTGLDMPGLLTAFQQFWRENANAQAFLAQQFHEAYPHLVLQAFLQRVINGGGEIVREMALGSGRLDLGVRFRGAVYAVEVKTADQYAKSHVQAQAQIIAYMDRLGVAEGWLVVFDSDLAKPWEEKIRTEHRDVNGKAVHIVFC